MHFIPLPTRKTQIYFCSCNANCKWKFKLLTALNFCPVLNISRLYTCLFLHMVLFCKSFGTRSEPESYALQLLIKMLIRGWLTWDWSLSFYTCSRTLCLNQLLLPAAIKIIFMVDSEPDAWIWVSEHQWLSDVLGWAKKEIKEVSSTL